MLTSTQPQVVFHTAFDGADWKEKLRRYFTPHKRNFTQAEGLHFIAAHRAAHRDNLKEYLL